MVKKLIVIFLFILFAHTSFAQVYKWVDDQGALHFTDDFTQIPEKYRPKTDRMLLPQENAGVKKESDASSKDGYRDRLGRGEAYWKSRVEESRNRLKTLEEKAESLRNRYNQMTERINSTRSSSERANLRRERDEMKNEIDQCKSEIEGARNVLEKEIPKEAEAHKAKPDWLK